MFGPGRNGVLFLLSVVIVAMSDAQSIEMDADERDAFLGTGGTGVISFAGSSDEPPHSLPVSYGYDDSEATFYFRLAVGSESDKGDVAGVTSRS